MKGKNVSSCDSSKHFKTNQSRITVKSKFIKISKHSPTAEKVKVQVKLTLFKILHSISHSQLSSEFFSASVTNLISAGENWKWGSEQKCMFSSITSLLGHWKA